MHVRVCVDCGEEFRPETARCSDCGGVLEDRYEGGDGRIEVPSAPGQPPAGPDTRPFAFAADVRNLVPVAEALRAAGLPSHIVEREGKKEERHPGFLLGVRDGDRLAAMAVLQLMAEPASGVTVLDAPPAAEGEAGETACPACDTPVSEGVPECPECGLILGAEPGE